MLSFYLKENWSNLIHTFNIDEDVSKVMLERICAAYTEPHRAFHNLEHVEHVLRELDGADCDNYALHWAAWYHDFVYEPGSKSNEIRSIQVAFKTLNACGIDLPTITTCVSCITATIDHAPTDYPAVNLFLDADMSILGAPSDVYEKYLESIAYEHKTMPQEQLRQGRAAFVKDLLTRGHIFISRPFRDKYEIQAKTNLVVEQKSLTSKSRKDAPV